MITDKNLTFADSVAMGNTGTRVIGDTIDVKSLGADTNAGGDAGGLRDVGSGQPLYVVATVDEAIAFAGTTDHSYTLQVWTGANADGTDSTVIATFANPNTTDVAAGFQLGCVALPTEGSAYAQYVGLQEVVVGTTTTGKLNAVLTIDPRAVKSYADSDPGF